MFRMRRLLWSIKIPAKQSAIRVVQHGTAMVGETDGRNRHVRFVMNGK